MKKKGFVNDGIFFIVSFFVLIVILIAVYTGYSAIMPQLTDSENAIYTVEGASNADKINDVYLSFDTLFILLFIGLACVMLISAILIKVHPVFAIIALFSFIIMVILSMILANTYTVLDENESTSEATSKFTKISFVMDNYPLFIIPIIMLFLIILFSKAVYDE